MQGSATPATSSTLSQTKSSPPRAPAILRTCALLAHARLAFLLLAGSVLGVLFAACGARTGTMGGRRRPGTCAQIGESCADTACCNNVPCQSDQTCKPDQICKPRGESRHHHRVLRPRLPQWLLRRRSRNADGKPCGSVEQCCNFNCVNGVAAASPASLTALLLQRRRRVLRPCS
ncbi:MAG: hypothetical protein R3B70_15275 [Polyangiaceae bacterium]